MSKVNLMVVVFNTILLAAYTRDTLIIARNMVEAEGLLITVTFILANFSIMNTMVMLLVYGLIMNDTKDTSTLAISMLLER